MNISKRKNNRDENSIVSYRNGDWKHHEQKDGIAVKLSLYTCVIEKANSV